MKQFLIILSIISLFVSCEKDIIDSSRKLTPEPFVQIQLSDAFDVFLTEGNEYSIEIIGDAEMISYVDLSVNSKVLTIQSSKKFKWLSPEKNKTEIYVTSPPLEKVSAAEGCNIQTLSPITSIQFGLVLQGKSNQASLELDGKAFYYWNDFPSGGKLTLTGNTETLKIWNFALMSVDAKNLTAKNAVVENGSKGDCEVYVTNKLQYKITEEGNIHLYGNPLEIIENGLSSSGRLIQH